MIDDRKIVQHAVDRLAPPEPSFERLLRRRDRKHRNQRITAGVVGISVFVAMVWLATTGGPFDRSRTPGATGSTVSPSTTIAPLSRPPLTAAPWFPSSTSPDVDYVLDLGTGSMTPLPGTIIGSLGGGRSNSDGRYAASPDGSTLAYVAPAADGRYQIFVASLDGSGIRQVTSDPVEALAPAWSPDGTRIVYEGHNGRGVGDLFIVDITTGASTQITDEPRDEWSPQFTTDGSSVLYSSGDGEPMPELRMVPVAGGESTLFIGADRGLNDAGDGSISPDGSLVTYLGSGFPDGGGHCGPCRFVANVDGTDRRAIWGWMANPAGTWSPDSTRIVATEKLGPSAPDIIVVVNVASGEATKVAKARMAIWVDDHTLLVEV